MNKIKITFFLQNLEVGGAERSIVRLAKALNKDYFEVSFLLCCASGPLLKDLPTNIKITDLKKSHVGLSLSGVIKYFYREKPDIVLSALDHVNVINIIAGLFCFKKPKIIITERSTFSRVSTHSAIKIRNKLISRFIMPLMAKLLYKKADSIICVSKGVADDISKIIGSLSNIKVIYNPVIDDSFLELVNEKIEDSNFLKKSLPNVLAVGRLTKAKDYPTLLKAFSIVIKEIPANLLIIGDGEDKSNIIDIINNLKISENVFLLGFQKNPLKYMAKADVFVLSSILEGFPNALVEAMACGVPAIATDCQSGPNEIIEDGKSGFLVPVSDEVILAKMIVKLLKDAELRGRISEEGKKRAKYFSVARSTKEFEDVFLKILNK